MRTKLLVRVLAIIAAVFSFTPAQAEEKNGLLVTISKKTLERNDTRTTYSTRLERTQGLGLTVKNNSIKNFPAGEVQWTIVVRKSYEGGLQKYSGKEVLSALRPSASTELVFGAAQTGGYRSDYSSSSNYKDKVEYEVVITHNGKETMRTSSDPNFTNLALRATSMDREVEVAVPRVPAVAPAAATTIPAPGVRPPHADIPPKPIAPAPADAPTAEIVTPPSPPTPPAPPTQPGGKPFDFFNIDKNKK